MYQSYYDVTITLISFPQNIFMEKDAANPVQLLRAAGG